MIEIRKGLFADVSKDHRGVISPEEAKAVIHLFKIRKNLFIKYNSYCYELKGSRYGYTWSASYLITLNFKLPNIKDTSNVED